MFITTVLDWPDDQYCYTSTNQAVVKTEDYTEELAKKTDGYGDCCLFTVLQWGHSSRNNFSEDVNDFDDEDHMDQEGQFSFQVNETCLHGSSKSFLIAQDDKGSLSRFVLALKPLVC